MAVKVIKKVKYATALYHKINATKSTSYMESLLLFSKSAYLLDYAAPHEMAYFVGQKEANFLFKILNHLTYIPNHY